MVIELETDMITIKEEPRIFFPDKKHGKVTDFEGHEFFEASSIRKISALYFTYYGKGAVDFF